MAWVASLGVRAVHLDATLDSLRPRQLDRSARRDVAAILRRHEIAMSGLDLWIPPEHFANPAHSERALDAAIAALELAGELAPLVGAGSRPVVSVLTPVGLASDVAEQLASAALRSGSVLADHRIASANAAKPSEGTNLAASSLGVGIDPAAVLLAGSDPAVGVLHAGERLVSARLSDATTAGRIAPGESGSRLDLLAYVVALRTIGHHGHAIIDLRGVAQQARAATQWLDAIARVT